jgi:putative membrane protein
VREVPEVRSSTKRAPDPRWPPRVYRHGTEPDPRYTLANERTFLAWIRTSIAMLAAGVALESYAGNVTPWARHLGAGMFILVATCIGSTSFAGWMSNERALRLGHPLRQPRLMPVLAAAIVAAGILLSVGLLLGPG